MRYELNKDTIRPFYECLKSKTDNMSMKLWEENFIRELENVVDELEGNGYYYCDECGCETNDIVIEIDGDDISLCCYDCGCEQLTNHSYGYSNLLYIIRNIEKDQQANKLSNTNETMKKVTTNIAIEVSKHNKAFFLSEVEDELSLNDAGKKILRAVKRIGKEDMYTCASCKVNDSIYITFDGYSSNFKITCANCTSIIDHCKSDSIRETIYNLIVKAKKKHEDNLLRKAKEEINDTKTIKNNKVEEGDKKMKRANKGFNMGAIFGGLDFGIVKGEEFRLSTYGVAYKNEDTYVAYDKSKEELVNVDVFNFDADGLIMKMPVAMSQVNTGDIIIHQDNPVVVKSVREDGNIEVIAPGVAEIKIIMPIKNIFGFNFYTKVMPLIDFGAFGQTADNNNPFGSMMPMMMMSSIMGDDEDMDPMTMMFMMNSMNGDSMDMQSMLPLMLLGKSKDMSDIMPLLMMQQMNNSNSEMDIMQSMLPLMMMGDSGDMKSIIPFMMMQQTGMFNSNKQEVSVRKDMPQDDATDK